MANAILLAAVLTARCQVACLYEGYDAGRFKKPDICVCETLLKMRDLLSKKFPADRAPSKAKEPESSWSILKKKEYSDWEE
jgi:hypothetical protein